LPSGRLHPQFTAESGSIVWDTRDRCTAGHVDHDGARVNEERLEVDDKFDSVNVVDLGEHGMGNDEVQSLANMTRRGLANMTRRGLANMTRRGLANMTCRGLLTSTAPMSVLG